MFWQAWPLSGRRQPAARRPLVDTYADKGRVAVLLVAFQMNSLASLDKLIVANALTNK